MRESFRSLNSTPTQAQTLVPLGHENAPKSSSTSINPPPRYSQTPTRPPRSPLRETYKRRRTESALSAAGLEVVRGVLNSFRKSLRASSPTDKESPRETAPPRTQKAPKPSYRGLSFSTTTPISAGRPSRSLSTGSIGIRGLFRDPRFVPPEPPSSPRQSVLKEAPTQANSPDPSVIRTPTSAHHFAAIVALMDPSTVTHSKGKQKASPRHPLDDAAQGRSKQSIGRVSSRQSLSRLQTGDLESIPATPVTGGSTAFLRPAPRRPSISGLSPIRYAQSSSRQPSPSPGAQRSPVDKPEDTSWVEIPRFKKRGLNLEMVQGRMFTDRLAWVVLWLFWLGNALLGLFFDVNTLFILIQCVSHPAIGSGRQESWTFATAAYVICWAISVLGVWLCWEVGYEFWRRWRLARPAIEPIYFSLPATLHLSLFSFQHFRLFAHIRLSLIGTAYARDIVPETCHALVQLLPGLVPILPRAAIAVVLLLAFSGTQTKLATPFGATDQVGDRDRHFFRQESPGQLTPYAKGVLLAFVAWTALRIFVVVISALTLWVTSAAGLSSVVGRGIKIEPTHRASRFHPRDPSTTESPEKSWLAREHEYHWLWQGRARARLQDAFELCMFKRQHQFPSTAIPWGQSAQGDRSARQFTPQTERFTAQLTPLRTEPSPRPATLEPPRPESQAIPTTPEMSRPPVSRGITHLTNRSSNDVFYTPVGPLFSGPMPSEFGVLGGGPNTTDVTTNKARDRAASLSAGRPSSNKEQSLSSRSSSLKTIGGLNRARSTSIGLLKEGVAGGSALLKRVRSGGTLLSAESHYSTLEGEDYK